MREMKDSGVAWIGEIPETWEIKRIKEEYSLQAGFTPDTKNESYYDENGYDWVTISDIEDGKTIFSTKKKVSQKYITEFSPSIIPKGSLLYSFKLSVGQTAFAGKELYSNEAIAAFFPDESISLSFLRYSSFLIVENAETNIYGAKILNRERIKNALVVYPPLSDQQKIAAHLDRKCTQIDALISNAQQQIEKLKAYKQSVITETVTKGLDPDVTMKDSGVEWIGEIPEHCSLVPMKYLAEAIGDGIHATPNYDINGNVFFINGNNIGEEQLQFKESTNRINSEELAKYKAPHLTNNTIMISLNGTYGKTSFYNDEPVLLGKSAGYITLKPSVNKKYIRYYLQSGIAKLIIDLSLAGTTIPNVSLRTLNTILVIYPELQEQEEIVAYLDRKCSQIDRLIAIKQQKIEKLQQYKKSLIYEYVTGKKEVS